MRQECKIRYCMFCQKFYIDSCDCFQNSLNTKIIPSIIYTVLNIAGKLLKQNSFGINHSSFFKNHLNKDFLSKYVYLSASLYNPKPITKFYVYMFTVNSEGEDIVNKYSENKSELSSSSAISVSSRKSGSGNIIANWINKTRKKRKTKEDVVDAAPYTKTVTEQCFSEDDQSDTLSNQTQYACSNLLTETAIKEIPSKSKIPILKNKLCNSNGNQTILRNLCSKSSNVCSKSRSYENIGPGDKLQELTKKTKSNLDIKAEPIWKCSSYSQINMPIYKLVNLDLNGNFGSDLREIVGILTWLRESELHITQLLSKHIEDRNFQKELWEALSSHSKVHSDAERRTQNMASEMWLYQTEIAKNQEVTLQDRLNTIIKQNRLLQDEVDHLIQKNEKLCIKIQQYPDRTRLPPDSGTALLEGISRNNDILRCKASRMSDHMEKQESEFQKLLKKYQQQEQQLRNYNSQLQNYKDIVQRMQTDNKLAYENLSQQLQMNQTILKESAEAGDVLLEDLDSLKRQLKSVQCSINWTKFKCRGHTLPDLIYMCRSCINELSKELLLIQNDNVLKDKDIQCLREAASRNEERMEQLKFEQDQLRNELKLMSHYQVDLQNFKSKYADMEKDYNNCMTEMKQLEQSQEEEKNGFAASLENLENLRKEVVEKDEDLLLIKEQIAEYKSENDALRMQLQGLKQVLAASGAGEVAKELAETQEKLIVFQSQYYQILSEKNNLMDKLQAGNVERVSLSQFQTSSSQFMQAQQHELDALKKDSLVLRQQFEKEHHQAAALKLERNKLREEKSMMKEIYFQLKNEINRVQTLEGKMTGMSMEANKLALIADYNRQLGEKLQCEVAERDVKITKLETNMKELNNAQLENAKDKVALCAELTEVCSLNDKLSNSLLCEHQKIDELQEATKQIEAAASVQLRAAERMQKEERAALMELLQDYKCILSQRDNLFAAQTEYAQQISELRANIVILNNNLESARQNHALNIESIQNLQSKLREANQELSTYQCHAENKGTENSQLKNESDELKKQKRSLESSITYLQNTIQQLHRDLNKSRELETELRRELQNETKKLEQVEGISQQHQASLQIAREDNQELIQKTSNLSTLYEELLRNYKHDTTIKNEDVENIKQELKKAEELVLQEKGSRKSLEGALAEKQCELLALQEHCGSLSEQLSEMETYVGDSDLQSKMLSESNSEQMRLQTTLTNLRSEHEHCSATITNLKNEKEDLEEKLQEEIDKEKSYYAYYKNYVDAMKRQHNEVREEMQNDLQTFAIEFEEARSKYSEEKSKHEQLTQQHKNLATQLLLATQLVIDEKIDKFQADASIRRMQLENTKLSAEKVQKDSEINSLTKEIKDLTHNIKEQIVEKKKLQTIIAHLENIKMELEYQITASQNDLKNARENTDNTCNHMEVTLTETKNKLHLTQELVKSLKMDLDNSHQIIMQLQGEVSKLQQNFTSMEFQKSETTLRLHELQGSLKTEQKINMELTKVNQKIVTEILQFENQVPPPAALLIKYLNSSDSDTPRSCSRH